MSKLKEAGAKKQKIEEPTERTTQVNFSMNERVYTAFQILCLQRGTKYKEELGRLVAEEVAKAKKEDK